MFLNKKSVRTRVAILIGGAVAAMIALAAMSIIDSRSRIAEFHLENAKTAIAATLAMLEQDQALVDSGEYSLEEAQKNTLARLREFRYNDGEGYVAITEDDGFMTMHPVHEHLDQSNIWEMRDVEGSYIAQDIIRIGQEEKIGVNSYYFEHPKTGEIDVKTSAVGRFEPWGWTLIVGVFQKSVDSATQEMMDQAMVVVASMSCVFLLLAIAIGRSLSEPISALNGAMTSIADGRLDTPIPFQDYRNECGAMARALAVFRDSGRKIVELQAEKEEAQRAAEQQRLEMTTRLRDQFGDVLDAANRGDFTKRVTTDLADENLEVLAQTLNEFVEKVEAGVSTVEDAMSSMSEGRRPSAHAETFEGAFADMLGHVAKTADIIRSQAEYLEYSAHHDALTGLPNRRYFEHAIAQSCRSIKKTGGATLLHIDLDRFKQINDALGHDAGDEVLRHSARTLRSLTREQDFVARIGGDEFIVLCDEDNADGAVTEIASAIVSAFGRPYAVESGLARFGASVGVASVTDHASIADDLMKNADLALYSAKRNGRNQLCCFSPEIRAEFEQTKRTADDILRGLENKEFIPYFQPQIDAETGAIVGVEALARWRHPEKGVLSPFCFLSIAEDLGVVDQIDVQVFHGALEGVARINAHGVQHIEKLSVNVSFARLMDPELPASLDAIGPLDHRLVFELLESIVFDDQGETFKHQLDALKERGMEIEIDDFGSGRASITGLLAIAPHRLKVDRQLIAPIIDSEPQRKLIEAILEIGETLEIGIIAEGVETPAHAEMLRRMNCSTLQGFAFAPPLEERAFLAFLNERAGRAAS